MLPYTKLLDSDEPASQLLYDPLLQPEHMQNRLPWCKLVMLWGHVRVVCNRQLQQSWLIASVLLAGTGAILMTAQTHSTMTSGKLPL